MTIPHCFFFIPMLIFQLHFGFLMLDWLAIAIGHCCALLAHHPLLLLGQVLAQCFQLEMKQLKSKSLWMDYLMDGLLQQCHLCMLAIHWTQTLKQCLNPGQSILQKPFLQMLTVPIGHEFSWILCRQMRNVGVVVGGSSWGLTRWRSRCAENAKISIKFVV